MIKRILILLGASFFIISSVFANQGGDDNFGYMWTDSRTTQPPYITMNWIDALDGTSHTPVGDDVVYGPISLGFTFRFYGTNYTNVYISTNGFISFTDLAGNSYPVNGQLSDSGPTTMIAPFWDDLTADRIPFVLSKTTGVSPNRQFVVMWNSAVILDPPTDRLMTFEVVLYETSNLIKFQYGYSREGAQGLYATIGIKSGTNYVQYSYNQAGAVNQNYAILFHPDNANLATDGADANISPTSVQASTALRQFRYQVSNIFPSQTTGLGKIDRLSIANPFTSFAPTVIGVYINGNQAFIQNSANPPSQRGFATWYYQSDSLIIQTDNFEIIDSLRVNFIQTLTTPNNGDYASRIDARLDSIGIQDATADPGWTVTVTPANPHHFVKLSAETPLTVGTTRAIQVRLEDEFNNTIDGSTITFTRTSSGNGYFGTPGNSTTTAVTAGGGVASATYTASTQVNSSPDVIHVSIGSVSTTFTLPLVPDDADHFVVLGGTENPMEVGTERLLQVRLEDAYGNYLRDSLVTFTRFHGSGIFPGNGSNTIPVTTGVNGIAEALYRASNSIAFVNDSIRVDFNGLLDTLALPLVAGAVSYYEFNPAEAQNTTAGVGVNYTITARDIYGNGVVNNDNINLTASGSTTAVFNPVPPLSFANDSTVNFTVTDNVVGSFTVVGVKVGSPGVTGQSGLITVQPDEPAVLIYISGNNNNLIPGNSQLLRSESNRPVLE